MNDGLTNIVIVGGGSAGWMTAAALSHLVPGLQSIQLIESDEIGTVGVGEATVPHLRLFNEALQINEADFVRAVGGTFKLGIEFVDWGRIGDRYIHGFGTIGHEYRNLPFHQYWLKLRAQGKARDLGEYSLNTAAASAGKFMSSASDVPPQSPLANISYAYHFDAGLYANYLRRMAEARGVKRIEGQVVDVSLRGADGCIESVTLKNGTRVAGELFIDCSGFRGLLIEQTLKAGYEDWTHWLPCDRAVAVPSAKTAAATPFTRSTARAAGWQWRIPLQHRTGNGYVYSSAHVSDDEAAAAVLGSLDGSALAEPRVLKFATGRRREVWSRNCIAIGLSSGFIEPLESTSIHLIQRGIMRLLQTFPRNAICQADVDEYNSQTNIEIEHIRDFIVLHYHVTRRQDTPFWRACRAMDIPDSLRHRIELFRETGGVFRVPSELFAENSWIQVMLGQGIEPLQHHPVADLMGDEELRRFLDDIKTSVENTVAQLPAHQTYVEQYCRAHSE